MMSLILKNRRLLFLLFVLVMLTAGILMPWFVSWVINTDALHSHISGRIYEKSGLRLTSEKIHVDLFPKISLQINDISIRHSNETAVTIESAHVFLNLSSFIKQNLKIEEILLKNGHVLVENQLENTREASFFLPLALINPDAWISDLFSYFSKDQDDIKIRLVNFQTQYINHMDALLVISQKPCGISAQITIKRPFLDKEMLSALITADQVNIYSITAEEIQIHTAVNNNQVIDGGFSVHGLKILPDQDEKTPVNFELLDGTFTVSESHTAVHLTTSFFSFPQKNVSIDFSHSGNETSIVFSGETIDIFQARKAGLNILSGSRVCQELFWILQAGTADHIRVSFSSSSLDDLFSGEHLELSGAVSNGTAQIPQTSLTVSHVNANASVKDGVLYIDTQTGSLNGSSIQKGTLSIDLLHSDDHPFRGRFTIDVNLSSLPEILISLLPGTMLANELAQVESVHGTASADLSLSLESGRKQLDVIVTADTITGTGSYARIPGPIVIEQAGFEYQDNKVVIKNFNGMIHSQSLYNINTAVTLEPAPHIVVDSGTAMLDLETLLPWIRTYDRIRDMISVVKSGTGHVYFDRLRFSGLILDPDDWKYDMSGTCLNISLDTEDAPHTVTGLSGTFHYADRFFQMEPLNAVIHTVDFLSLPSEKKIIDSINTPFQIINSQFISQPEFSEFTGEIILPEDIRMDVKARKDSNSDMYELMALSIEDPPLSDIKVQLDRDHTSFVFSGKLDSTTLKKIVKRNSLLYDTIFKISNDKAFTIEAGFKDQIKVSIESMDASFLFDQQASEGFSWEAIKDKTILLDIDTLNIKKFNFLDFKSRIIKKDHRTMIHISNAKLCSLLTKGIFTISKHEVTCDLKFSESQDSELSRTLLCLFNQSELITGPYTFNGQIRSEGTMADFSRSFQGDLAFNARDGRIFRLSLLSRILSLLNVSKFFKGSLPDISQQGFAYHQIDITARIQDTRIYLDRAVIDGKDMTLVFTGWIDPLENQLDLTCLVAPFKTVDMIISKIPIINTLFDGRLVSVPVKARGKVNDPVVIPLHPSSVGEGLVDMMVNILKAPVTLIEQTQ